MSIIYEALRKTQRNRELHRGLKSLSARPDLIDIGLYIIIVFLLLVTLTLAISHLRHEHRHTVVAKPVVTPPVQQAAALPPAPRPIPSINNLVFNGVFLSDQDKVALINNKAFYVGDTVQGLRVVNIEFDSVELSDGIKTFMLRTNS